MFWLFRATSLRFSVAFWDGQQVLLAKWYLSIETTAFDNSLLKLTQALFSWVLAVLKNQSDLRAVHGRLSAGPLLCSEMDSCLTELLIKMTECHELKSRKHLFLAATFSSLYEVVLFFKQFSRGGWKKVNVRGALVVMCFNLFILNSLLNCLLN